VVMDGDGVAHGDSFAASVTGGRRSDNKKP
jgi:hypothetical protein